MIAENDQNLKGICVICYTPQFELLHVSLCPNRDMFIYLTVSDYGDIKTPFKS